MIKLQSAKRKRSIRRKKQGVQKLKKIKIEWPMLSVLYSDIISTKVQRRKQQKEIKAMVKKLQAPLSFTKGILPGWFSIFQDMRYC